MIWNYFIFCGNIFLDFQKNFLHLGMLVILHHFRVLYTKIEGNCHLHNLEYEQFDKHANDVGSYNI